MKPEINKPTNRLTSRLKGLGKMILGGAGQTPTAVVMRRQPQTARSDGHAEIITEQGQASPEATLSQPEEVKLDSARPAELASDIEASAALDAGSRMEQIAGHTPYQAPMPRITPGRWQ